MLSLGVRLPGAEVAGRRATSMPKSTEILEEMAKGLLLCDLATRLEGVHVGDVCARPKVTQEAMHNANRALDVFRRARRCRSDHMWSAREIAAGDAATCWGLFRGPPSGVRRREEKTVHREERSRPDRVGRAVRRVAEVPSTPAAERRRRGARRRARRRRRNIRDLRDLPVRTIGVAEARRGRWPSGDTLPRWRRRRRRFPRRARLARASRTRRAMDRGGDAKGRTRPPTSSAASPRRSSRTGRERARDASPAREARARVETNADPEGGPGSRYSRGGAIRSPSRIRRSSEGKGKPRAASATTRERPGYDPSGYVSPERGWPPPREVRAAISRFFTTRVAAFIREDGRDVRQVQVCQVQDGDRNHSFSSRFGRVGVSRGARGGARGERSRRV